MCDIIKSRNTQTPGGFAHYFLGNLTFHETIRKKGLYIFIKKKYHKKTILRITKSTKPAVIVFSFVLIFYSHVVQTVTSMSVRSHLMTLDVVYYRTAAYTLCRMYSGYHSL